MDFYSDILDAFRDKSSSLSKSIAARNIAGIRSPWARFEVAKAALGIIAASRFNDQQPEPYTCAHAVWLEGPSGVNPRKDVSMSITFEFEGLIYWGSLELDEPRHQGDLWSMYLSVKRDDIVDDVMKPQSGPRRESRIVSIGRPGFGDVRSALANKDWWQALKIACHVRGVEARAGALEYVINSFDIAESHASERSIFMRFQDNTNAATGEPEFMISLRWSNHHLKQHIPIANVMKSHLSGFYIGFDRTNGLLFEPRHLVEEYEFNFEIHDENDA